MSSTSATNQSSKDHLPRVFLLDPAILQTKKQMLSHDSDLQAALQQLVQQADELLHARLVSVVEKTQLPESGDIHDYLSLAPYWWPDPAKPDGLPYMHLDGQTNPGASEIPDKPNFQRMMPTIKTLALAYYFTDKEEYAAKVADFLRVWFLNPDTYMNPNLNHAQMVRGRNTGRAAGIIDARALSTVVDSIGFIQRTSLWTAQDQQGMENWFRRFLDWLLTSPLGREEAAARNNHGSWYDVLAASIALFVNKTEIARNIVEASKARRIDRHIQADGSQPYELTRTRSWHYSVFNLQALLILSGLGDYVGVDLRNYATPEGANLRTALDYLLPAAFNPQVWSYQEITAIKPEQIVDVLYLATRYYHESAYLQKAQAILGESARNNLNNLIYGV
ncbi:MAG TPA: alginate lyase family protein [Ktedonobacteraceae bacterium]|nr:alginate lyase family protein [Ktedonobacteraceae bacterium]